MIFTGMALLASAQTCAALTTVNVVDIQPGMTREARAYYEAGWAAARRVAQERGIIAGYDMMVSQSGVTDQPEIVLVTRYKDAEQLEAAEGAFQAIFRELDLPRSLTIEGKSRAEILGPFEGASDYRSVFSSDGDCPVPGHG